MATEVGSMSQLIDRLAKTEDPKTISELSREIREGARQVRVKLDDPDAFHYPFTFKKGDAVARIIDEHSIDDQSQGRITDGVYEGTVRPGGPYTVIYTVKTDDGVSYDARDLHLVPVPNRSQLPDKRAILKSIIDRIEPGWHIKKPSPLNPTDIEHQVILQHPDTYKEVSVPLENSLFQDVGQRQKLEHLVREAIQKAAPSPRG